MHSGAVSVGREAERGLSGRAAGGLTGKDPSWRAVAWNVQTIELLLC